MVSRDSVMIQCVLRYSSPVPAMQVLTSRLNPQPPLPIGLDGNAVTWDGDSERFSETTKLKRCSTQAHILEIPLTSCLYYKHGIGSWTGLFRAMYSPRRSKKTNRTTVGKAESRQGYPRGQRTSTDEYSGVRLLHWLETKPCHPHLWGSLSKPCWSHISSFNLRHSPGRELWSMIPFYRSGDWDSRRLVTCLGSHCP